MIERVPHDWYQAHHREIRAVIRRLKDDQVSLINTCEDDC